MSITDTTINREVSFINTVFHEGANFSESTFEKNVRFHNAEFFEKVQFYNTTFQSLVDFYFAIFRKDQQFHLTDFNDITIFSNTTFYGAIQFIHNKVTSLTYISFESAKFYKAIDLSRSNFLCKLKFWGVEFCRWNLTEISNNVLYQFDNMDMENSQNNITTLKKIRESMRIIKQSFRTEDNTIEALYFQKLELYCYKYEMALSKKKSELILLKLNSISNCHGTSWIRGFWFTILITLFFYMLFIVSISAKLQFDFSWNGFGLFLKYYIQLLNITNWNYYPFEANTEPWGDLLLYTSRIFISYGYYQTIQAFRKYTKN